MTWDIGAILLALFGLVFHAGVQYGNLRRMRKDLKELDTYAHNISHQTIEQISREINRIKRYLIRHVPNGIDEL